MSEYADRDVFELSPYLERHMSAMTGERLHSKAAIAAELAWRDKQLDTLLTAAKRLHARGHFNKSTCADDQTNADMAAMRDAIDAVAIAQ